MLQTLALSFPAIDPVAIHLGSLGIRWYSLAYVAGIVLGWCYVGWINKRPVHGNILIPKNAFDDMITWGVVGIILGGRLGYVLFYKPDYYLANMGEILAVWQGGMSFHGGLLGVLTAFYLFCRKYKLSYLGVMDLLACAAPIGICFGRLANFINGELWGRVTDAPVGMVFPTGGTLPRHPSQLYEAALEGVLLFTLLFLLVRFTRLREKTGALGGVFLMGYGLSRLVVEHYREPDAYLGFFFDFITMGQMLSVPMVLFGAYLLLRKPKAA